MNRVNALVIGAGAGGGIVAKELAVACLLYTSRCV